MKTLEELENERNWTSDRTIVLEAIPGEHTKSAAGMVDNRLLKGEAFVHAVKHPQSNLWGIKYSVGTPPPALRQNFTKFADLLLFVTNYFKKRGARVVEVRN